MLYVHLHQAAVQDPLVASPVRGPGVVRPEGLPPLDVLQLSALLGSHRLSITPVLDNRERQAVDQTSTDLPPLSRTAHRAKTHLGCTLVPIPAGVVRRTPHGLYRLVDRTGVTRHLTADEAATLVHGETPLDAALARILDRTRRAEG